MRWCDPPHNPQCHKIWNQADDIFLYFSNSFVRLKHQKKYADSKQFFHCSQCIDLWKQIKSNTGTDFVLALFQTDIRLQWWVERILPFFSFKRKYLWKKINTWFRWSNQLLLPYNQVLKQKFHFHEN